MRRFKICCCIFALLQYNSARKCFCMETFRVAGKERFHEESFPFIFLTVHIKFLQSLVVKVVLRDIDIVRIAHYNVNIIDYVRR